jgi:ferredoxin-nitrite reductase
VLLDSPVNIHLTGCHHSCAQHYIGDIGLIGARVETGGEGDTVEGYHIHVGGGFGPEAAIAREIYRDVKAEDAAPLVARMLQGYLAKREGNETFLAFSKRNDVETLRAMFGAEAVE